jgi:phosphoglycolate phosphatase-like HAD superfamily hydrolase
MRSALFVIALLAPVAALAQDPLPSWNEGDAKAAILDFVAEAADPSSDGFIPEPERVATFDNDGTLWSEKPVYFQVFYALDRAKRLAADDPLWAKTPALKAAAAGDIEAALSLGLEGLLEIVAATHSDLTVEDFTADVAQWLETARHPTTGRRFDEMIFRPMVELLDHLRANGFETYIVSGGGVDFMRAFAERAYGVPPQNVIGSMSEARFEIVDGEPQVRKDPGIAFVDDKGGKPVGIARHIGRRPVFVGGNSDGDLAMAQWSTAGDGPRFALFVHHTDAEREWAYDHPSHVGEFDKALAAAREEGWTVVDMAEDWATIWP